MEEGEGAVVWLTGLSGAGKTTIAGLVAAALRAAGGRVEVLDGDEVRRTLSRDLGFSPADRAEHIRRVARAAADHARAGATAVVAAISPYRAGREAARALVPRFIEVFVDAPLAVCERRDPKGLYARARRGEVADFTGISAPYEPPTAPEAHCRTDREGPDESAAAVLRALAAATGPR